MTRKKRRGFRQLSYTRENLQKDKDASQFGVVSSHGRTRNIQFTSGGNLEFDEANNARETSRDVNDSTYQSSSRLPSDSTALFRQGIIGKYERHKTFEPSDLNKSADSSDDEVIVFCGRESLKITEGPKTHQQAQEANVLNEIVKQRVKPQIADQSTIWSTNLVDVEKTENIGTPKESLMTDTMSKLLLSQERDENALDDYIEGLKQNRHFEIRPKRKPRNLSKSFGVARKNLHGRTTEANISDMDDDRYVCLPISRDESEGESYNSANLHLYHGQSHNFNDQFIANSSDGESSNLDDCFRDKFASVDSKAITDGRIGDFYSSSYEREVTATPQCSIKSDQFEYVNRIGHDSDLPQLDTGKTKSWDQVNVNRSVPLYDAMMDLSDSNLEAKLKFQWRLDRTKKAIRKKEREELRLLGRIGKGQKGKYEKIKNQVSIDIEKEIDKLLCSTSESRSLPSLGRTERKLVHEIAHKFGLKSKSLGKGKLRHPVLYKTANSVKYLDKTNNDITTVGRNSYDSAFRKQAHVMRNVRKPRGQSDRFAVSYRDGEIVGATAPELTADNVGNQLMRKLGWTPGEALGAHDNKGILHPVTHVVKTTKAGLG